MADTEILIDPIHARWAALIPSPAKDMCWSSKTISACPMAVRFITSWREREVLSAAIFVASIELVGEMVILWYRFLAGANKSFLATVPSTLVQSSSIATSETIFSSKSVSRWKWAQDCAWTTNSNSNSQSLLPARWSFFNTALSLKARFIGGNVIGFRRSSVVHHQWQTRSSISVSRWKHVSLMVVSPALVDHLWYVASEIALFGSRSLVGSAFPLWSYHQIS